MKQVIASQIVEIPSNVRLEVKARQVRVKGERGSITRDFKHLAIDLFTYEEDDKRFFKVECHFGKRKKLASIRTVCSHIQNMFKGVTYGYSYKMRLVYAHFPININIEENGKLIEIRNFLGEKRVRIVKMLDGVKVERSSAVKDQLVLSGNDLELVSRSASLINGVCHVRNKDIRKFLDGIYVENKGHIVQPADD